jgi:hypothetical protein
MTALAIPARRTYGWRTWQDALRESVLAIIAGVVVAFVENRAPSAATAVHYATIAVAVVLAARGMETALSWAIEQSRFPTLFRCMIYVLDGGIACFVVVGQEFDVLDTAIVAVLTASFVGFILHHNRKRNDRLRASIERLKEHEFAEKELEIARSVQRRLLPPELVEAGGYRIDARTIAAHIVGGDFYDVVRLDDGSVAVLAADVAGKGIAASLIMASCKAVIPFLASSGDPSRVLSALNEKLCAELQRREFVAMVYAHFQPKGGSVQIANAGMPEPLLIRSDGSLRTITCEGDRFPLGVRAASRYCVATTSITDGDRLLLFSDGLPEATVDGEPLGYEHIEIVAAQHESAAAIIDAVRAIAGARIEDDVTAVVVSPIANFEVASREAATES